MKRLLSIALILMIAAVSFAGCTSSQDSSEPASPTPAQSDASTDANTDNTDNAAGTYIIGVSMNSADQFRTSWLNEFKALAEAKGHTVYSTNADGNPSTQISDIESLVARKPDVIVVTALDSEGIVPAIEACNAANIPVIAIDMPIATEVAATVSDTQGLNGTIQADYLQSWLDEDPSRVANIGYIVGMYSMEAAMPRMNDFKAVTDTDPRCTWLVDKEANWSGAEAMSIAEDWIQAYPEMNVFACMSDEIAIGAIQALTAAGKNMDEVIVMGVDGSDAAMEYLKSGELDCTAARDVAKEVASALDTAEKLCAGESVSKDVYPEAIFPMTAADVQ